MNKIITHLDLDLASSNEYKVINAQQLDNNTRRLEVNLFHEGKIYDITNVTKIELQGFRGDGETIKTPLTNDGNNIIIDFDNSILGAKGVCKLKIALFGEDNKLLSSFPFVIRIDQNVYDETGVIASPVYLELENELKNIEDLKSDIETKLDDNYFVLKKDKDVAGGVPSLDSNTKVPIDELYEATTTSKGITQLTDSVTSTSTTTAATPNSVKAVNDSLNSEISRAKSAESTLTTNLNNEITRATDVESSLTTNLNAEIARAKSAENDLDSKKVDKTTVSTSTTLGLVKSGTDITVDTSGNVSVNDNSHKHNVSNISDLTATASELNVLDGITATTTELNYTDGVTSNIQTQLNSKSSNGHTHDDRYYTESEIDTTVTDINSSISSHTYNTSNPHSVTKAQVGLGDVENKSSATIRGEITKSNVTTALGYTPYTPNEIDNKFSALETNIDWKESVSTFDDIATTYPNPIDGWTVNVKDTDYTYRYNGTSWVAISANAIPKATNNVDGLLSKEDHTNYEDANSKKHTHSNKSVIDGISSTKVSNWDSAKTHADSTHARTDATKVEASSTNGNIKINGTETTVYTHPSGTNPHGTTKSDVGLGNVGDFKAVSTVASQGLTATEKLNARANIGAGTSSFSGSYNDLSNKPTLGTASSKDVASSGNASTSQVVMGNDTRLTDSRKASDVYAWAKESTKPSYTASEVGALPISDKNGVEVETPTIFNSELSVSKSLNIFKDSFTNMDFEFDGSSSVPYWSYYDGESDKRLYHSNKSGTIATTDDIKMYSAGTGITLSGTTFSNSGVRSITSGSTNGTISVNTNGTSAEVAVKGLGSAAYTSSSNYLLLSGGTLTGSIITPKDDNMGIIPATNNYGQIGSSDKKFYRMYASTFYGNLSGSATSANSANKNYLPRVAKSCAYQPGNNVGIWEEFIAGASYNLPDNAYYHIFTGQGNDPNYNTQLALGMTYEQVAYRCRQSGTWGSWKELAFTDRTATYEEGTWTPTNVPGSSSIDTSVYEFKNSEYRKIGDIVILTTTATPTIAESKVGHLMVANSFPFAFGRILSTFSINTNGNSSIGVCNNYGSTYDFGEYNFAGNSWGLTDVYVTIIYSL